MEESFGGYEMSYKYAKEYWVNYLDIKEYTRHCDRTNELLKYINKYIEANTSLHEFGCNVGRNLLHIRKEHQAIKLSGNDICKKAVKHAKENHDIFIYEKSTDDYLKEMEPVDYILTMAHVIHLPNEIDGILKEYLPNKFKRYVFCFEQNIKKLKISKSGGGTKFPRNLDLFFDLKIIDKIKMSRANYYLWIFQK